MSSFRKFLTELYHADTPRGVGFRYGMLVFDVITIGFLVGSSFTSHSRMIEIADAVIGAGILADFAARMWISKDRVRDLASPFGIADIIVIISLLAPIVGEGLAFLRVARIFRLLRSYQVMNRLKQDFTFISQNEQTVGAAVNLAIFIFVMTAIVYETQHAQNEKINNYLDALYFTVTTLTTTGFGDVTLMGDVGKLTAVVIMIAGVSLFLRLVQLMLRPNKVIHKCPRCGLLRHDPDAVHCKACGQILDIEDEGMD
jgi:voltage-gated potassium channel